MSKKRLLSADREHIRSVYAETRSIEETTKQTGRSRNTVHKCVQDLSALDKRSIYANRTVCKIDPETGEVLQRYKNLSIASKLTGIEKSNICHALARRTGSAGGYCWSYEDKLNNFNLPKKIHYSESRYIDRLLKL